MQGRAGGDSFYGDLEPFDEFEQVTDFAAYRAVPDDWVVMAGDITGSTRAIAAGRYKAVNTVGAAVITAVLNACRGVEVPFVFGGDGGTLAVPGSRVGAAADALTRLQAHSEAAFGLRLRAAAIPVGRLRTEGHDLRVRKLALGRGNHLAMFAGGGIERADAILKSADADDPDLLAADPGAPAPDLGGLSCRWEPLTATRGRMIALMVQPAGREDPAAVLGAVLTHLHAVLGGGLPAHAPATPATLRFRWPPRGLWLELAARTFGHGRAGAALSILATSLVQKWCHWRGATAGPYDGPRYLDELTRQTDFRKFDGALRTVLDCSEAEVAAIETWLDGQHRAGRLVWGLHADRAATMTCLVFSLEESEHIHFIDAAGGGFAKAAEALKARRAALRRNSA